MGVLTLFARMMIAHAVADYPLQGDFLSRAKSRFNPLAGVPWYQALGAHALIQAGFVWALTGLWWLGLAEFVAHAFIDDRKCAGKLTFNQDQALHAACKAVWALAAVFHP